MSSLTLIRAVAARRQKRRRRWLRMSMLLGVLFLGTQLWLWHSLSSTGLLPSTGGYAATFYALTGLHGLHVLGGLVYFVWTDQNLPAGHVEPNPIRYCAQYWHFMGAIWLVLFAVLYFIR